MLKVRFDIGGDRITELSFSGWPDEEMMVRAVENTAREVVRAWRAMGESDSGKLNPYVLWTSTAE